MSDDDVALWWSRANFHRAEAENLRNEIVRQRQRADRAEAAIARVRALHFVEPDDPQWCYECNVVMPCPTLRALDGDA